MSIMLQPPSEMSLRNCFDLVKKTLCFAVAMILLFPSAVNGSKAFSADKAQPFVKGTMGSEKFRIPAAWTLNDGRLLFSADMRNTEGSDSPQNIDTLVAVYDGEDFEYTVVNRFDDVEPGRSETESASYIDSALLQSKDSGRIFILTTAYPTGIGILNGEKGSGLSDERLALTDASGRDRLLDPGFEDGFARVRGTGFSVDEEFNIYEDGDPLFCEQKGTGRRIKQNLFFLSSELHVHPTSFLVLRYSDDLGKTWSPPKLLNYLKKESESFLGACPGRGALTVVDGRERLLFCVYNHSKTGREKTSVIYSDDNGETWRRSEELKSSVFSGKSSESQIINCPDGSLKMFSRNKSRFISSSRSFDGGQTWGKLKPEKELYCTRNCMVSFIATDRFIDGKQVVLGSFPRGGKQRRDGVISVGLMSADGETAWREPYHINDGFFAYSCLTELRDGRIACLFEDEAAGITLRFFILDDEGVIRSADGNDIEYSKKDGIGVGILRFFALFFAS